MLRSRKNCNVRHGCSNASTKNRSGPGRPKLSKGTKVTKLSNKSVPNSFCRSTPNFCRNNKRFFSTKRHRSPNSSKNIKSSHRPNVTSLSYMHPDATSSTCTVSRSWYKISFTSSKRQSRSSRIKRIRKRRSDRSTFRSNR